MSKIKQLKPNILIYTPYDHEFIQLKSYFQNLIGKNSYTIYHLPEKDLLAPQPIWKSNCVFLVTSEVATVSPNSSPPSISSVYLESFKNGGRLLSLPSSSSTNSSEKHAELFGFESVYEKDESIVKIRVVDDSIYYYSHSQSSGIHLIFKVNGLF